jgi:hypothetical protein
VAAGLVTLAGANACYQLWHKPTEILGLVAPAARKPPAETWRTYRSDFEAHSTAAIPPELLAALVQAESSGDPLARPPWRFRWTTDPLALYAPASSAVGILQMTDANYQQARRLCIRHHEVAREGAWYDPSTCFLNAFYFRSVPGHSIEMTAAYLHVTTEELLARPGVRKATPAERQALAAVVHLCGRERGAAFAKRGFRPLRGERCGDQDVRAYLARVRSFVAMFAAERAG